MSSPERIFEPRRDSHYEENPVAIIEDWIADGRRDKFDRDHPLPDWDGWELLSEEPEDERVYRKLKALAGL